MTVWAGGQGSTACDETVACVREGQGISPVGLGLWQCWEAPKPS